MNCRITVLSLISGMTLLGMQENQENDVRLILQKGGDDILKNFKDQNSQDPFVNYIRGKDNNGWLLFELDENKEPEVCLTQSLRPVVQFTFYKQTELAKSTFPAWKYLLEKSTCNSVLKKSGFPQAVYSEDGAQIKLSFCQNFDSGSNWIIYKPTYYNTVCGLKLLERTKGIDETVKSQLQPSFVNFQDHYLSGDPVFSFMPDKNEGKLYAILAWTKTPSLFGSKIAADFENNVSINTFEHNNFQFTPQIVETNETIEYQAQLTKDLLAK